LAARNGDSDEAETLASRDLMRDAGKDRPMTFFDCLRSLAGVLAFLICIATTTLTALFWTAGTEGAGYVLIVAIFLTYAVGRRRYRFPERRRAFVPVPEPTVRITIRWGGR
jgi:hypothetical protein